MKTREMMRTVLFVAVIGFSSIAMAGNIVDEDFSTDPTTRGWVDSSANNFSWQADDGQTPPNPVEAIVGVNIKRDLKEAFYIPLGRTLTQNDSFTATFDLNRWLGAGATSQAFAIGFFNADDYLNGTTQKNELRYHFSDYGTGTTSGRVSAKYYAEDGTSAASTVTHVLPDMWDTYTMTFTAGAGANGAGQFSWTRSSDGVTKTIDLLAGAVLNLDSFGVTSGYAPYINSDGLNILVDNVTVTPEPATMGLLAVGAIGVLLRKRRR